MSRRPPPTDHLPPASSAATAPISVVRRPLGPRTKSNVLSATLAPANPALKTQVKLEDRLSKAETCISDLTRERTTALNELGDLQTELRLAAQREAKLKHSLERWEKSHATLKEKSSKLNDLQSRLAELHKVHEESKARRQKEIEDLTEKLKREEERRKRDAADAKYSLAGEKARAEEYQAKCREIEAKLESLRVQGTASDDVLREKQKMIEELEKQCQSEKIIAIDAQKYARRIENELNQRIIQLQEEVDRKTEDAARSGLQMQASLEAAKYELQSELDTLQGEMEETKQQHAQNLAMVANAVSEHIDALQQQSRSEKDVLLGKWHHNATERISLETMVDEQAAQIHELVAVVKQVQDDRDAAKQLVSALQADLVSITAELSAERQLATLLVQQQEEQQQNRINLASNTSFGDLSGLTSVLDSDEASPALLRGEMEDLQSRNSLLESEAAELQTRLISRSAEAKASEEALSTARAQLSTLESSLAAKSHEIETLISQLSELEPLRKRLAAANTDLASAHAEAASATEAQRSLSASLANSRLAEKTWREERDHLASLLDSSEHYQELYVELVDQTKLLVERNALLEEEKAELSSLNAELLSHNNPNQKIMYMDRVRQELDEKKRENLALRMELERAEEERKGLEKELRAYKSVDVPLGRRPRADVVRVARVDQEQHQGLLRKVSGLVEVQQTAMRSDGGVSTPVRAGFGVTGVKAPFTSQGPRFTAVPLQPELQKSLSGQTKERRAAQEEEVEQEEGFATGSNALPHPPLPVDTGLSPKKRRSYGNLSVHAAGEVAEEEEPEQIEDDTLLPLPTATSQENVEEVAVRRNRPRHTLVNSGALRIGQPPASASSSSIPVPVSSSAPAPIPAFQSNPTTQTPAAGRRPSLATSTLGIKARRVSELVRASTPPLPSIADFSSLETPNAHLVDAALPCSSPYWLADWTAIDETSHVPALNPLRHSAIAHSTPLPHNNARMRKSRYSGAQRIPLGAVGDSSVTPRAGLMGAARKSALMGMDGGMMEDEGDSFRKGWLYGGDEDQFELPEFLIEQKPVGAATAAAKKGKKVKGRVSSKIAPGPMARTFFR
ncbi:uncharacterized protein UHOD_03168 [Ustilago sp. UG-2017b]|nr:uncharacterized protein UHOD_03168 [Ustilago sp. UG-2017b]